jgi:UTP--glucose-1-phosphate uridylyltransferase
MRVVLRCRDLRWAFNPAIAACGLQGTASSPSSTTTLIVSIQNEAVNCGPRRGAPTIKVSKALWHLCDGDQIVTVTRAVILAAGFGTRMLPATKALPKEMLPLVDTPIIEYIVDEVVSSGIQQVIIVTSAGKRAIEDHFGRAHDLEQALEAKGDSERLELVRRATEMAHFVFVRQHEMGGIAHAVQSAHHAIGDEPFVLILPDDVIAAHPPATRQLLDVFERFQRSVLCVEPVPEAEIPRYGIICPRGVEPGLYQIDGLVEKPAPQEAPSNLAIIGRYVFTPAIFDAIARTSPGAGGELQITDAMARLREREPLYACELKGRRYDTGQPLGYLKAQVEFVLKRSDYGPAFRRYLLDLACSELARAEQTGQRG